ncbi:DHHA2 domain-containing protein [Spirochaeta isovalerica]|uniref:Inorganic pyrophosphatase/exopolyphosphatase n=1 Tax=Spirochaeta isovalerica TaxID=150 RepID=A0A841RHC6_9SPIO|nr:DHHA2 domain-containing protein [Spirochaeta isovalerica]MBB6481928.1 inorganic pyrophosphatase/exopolyphosphatase [Spirochaeta isovalerica]
MPPFDDPLILISGNRSGDLDSLITSYVKAELLSAAGQRGEFAVLRYFPEEKWKLHRDARYLIEQCGGNPDIFTGADQAAAAAAHRPVKIYLTDHNQPEQEILPYSENIVEITDHHRISGNMPQKAVKRIENTGSCSTLLAEELFHALAEKPGLFSREKIISLSEMLYFTIRMDTDHLTDEKQYNLNKDRGILEKLKKNVKKEEGFLLELHNKKEDFSGFAIDDYLEKDYKFWTLPSLTYGMSTIHCDIDTFFELLKADQSAVGSFMKKRNLPVLFLMHFNKEPILKRELTVICQDPCPFREKLIDGLASSGLFIPRELPEKGLMRFYQKDPHFSRKKIQPFLDDLLIKLTEDN